MLTWLGTLACGYRGSHLDTRQSALLLTLQNIFRVATVPNTFSMSRCSEFNTVRSRQHAVLGVPKELTTGLSRAARSAHNELTRASKGLLLHEGEGMLCI